jgi:hypothetical protein
VSDADNSPTIRRTFGSRRVSVLVGLPVIIGCGVLGSVIGITHPLQSIVGEAEPGPELSDLRLTSAKLVDGPSRTAQQPAGPHAASEAPEVVTGLDVAGRTTTNASSSVLPVSTGSVDRALPPSGSLDVAATQGERPELVHPEGTPRDAGHSYRQARAKRLRRILGRHTRAKAPGAQVDAFISSILPIK